MIKKKTSQTENVDVEKIIDDILSSCSVPNNTHPTRRTYPDPNLYNDTVVERANNKYIDSYSQRLL